MPTTYSDLLRLAKQATGENDNTWGDIFNANTLEMIEDAIAGVESISVTAGNVTLTTNNGIADQARNMALKFTGSPGTTRSITVPTTEKFYIVHNATTDSSNITLTTGSGGTITVLPNELTTCYCDGTELFAPKPLLISQNLSDLQSAATARTNLDVYSTTEVDTEITNATDSIVSAIVGEIKMWPTASAPSEYLLCDGSAVSRTTYASLFSAIGTTFGTGDGSTTFNLPDFRGRSPVGVGQGSTGEGGTTGTNRALAATGGAEETTLDENMIPDHRHVTSVGSSSSFSKSWPFGSSGSYSMSNEGGAGTITRAGRLTGDMENFTSPTSAVDIMSPFLGINFIIYSGV